MNYRPQWLAEGVEDLLSVLDHRANEDVDFDVVVVGSGYGGAVAAARLAQATIDGRASGLRICVLERGQEYVPDTFPGSLSELPGCLRFSRYDDPESKGQADGLFDFRLGEDISVLVGNGLGGGSLINASVAERAKPDVFEDPAWPAALRRDSAGRDDCYRRAEAMLGVVDAQVEGIDKYRELGAFAKALGEQARPARIAVNFTGGMNAQGVRSPDVAPASPGARWSGLRQSQRLSGLVQAIIVGQQSQRPARLAGEPPGACKLDRVEAAQGVRFGQFAGLFDDLLRHLDFENLGIVGVEGGDPPAVLGFGGALLAQHAGERRARLGIRDP